MERPQSIGCPAHANFIIPTKNLPCIRMYTRVYLYIHIYEVIKKVTPKLVHIFTYVPALERYFHASCTGNYKWCTLYATRIYARKSRELVGVPAEYLYAIWTIFSRRRRRHLPQEEILMRLFFCVRLVHARRWRPLLTCVSVFNMCVCVGEFFFLQKY